jgi:hypothetical protein
VSRPAVTRIFCQLFSKIGESRPRLLDAPDSGLQYRPCHPAIKRQLNSNLDNFWTFGQFQCIPHVSVHPDITCRQQQKKHRLATKWLFGTQERERERERWREKKEKERERERGKKREEKRKKRERKR